MTSRLTILLAGAAILATLAAPAHAVTWTGSGTSDGYDVSATADFNIVGNALDITLSNTTPTTHDACQLLTGLDFTTNNGSKVTLDSASATGRSVAKDGSFSDTPNVDLLTARKGKPTWEVSTLSSHHYQLDFNPDAKYAIIGPSTDGDYSGANGSIKGNAGHNPFSAESASFSLSGFNADTQITGVTFLYCTDFGTCIPGTPGQGTPPPVPEPAALALLPLALVGLGLRRKLQR